jgi:hypothetical protein
MAVKPWLWQPIAAGYAAEEPLNPVNGQTNAAVPSSGLTDIGVPIPILGVRNHVIVEVQNLSGSIAMVDFALLLMVPGSDQWHTLISDGGWNIGNMNIDLLQVRDSVAITSLAAGASAFAVVNFHMASHIKFQAQASGGTGSVRILGGAWWK